MVRVAIVAADASARERLAEALRVDPGISVAASADEPPGVEADVILHHMGDGAAGGGDLLDDLTAGGIPVLVIGPPGRRRDALAAGARGYLSIDPEPEALAAGVRAAAAGLTVLEPPPAATEPATGPETIDAIDVEELTDREQEVLALLAEGLSNKEIARRLRISDHTVKFHVNAILGKLGAHTRTEAVSRAARRGLITF